MQKKIDEIFSLWQDHVGPGCQILVTQKGKTIYEKCFGYANLETMTPITQDSVFHVASVSKQFTAMAILMLHEQGKLSIFDDVRKYIPDLIQFSEPLTIKQMMNHVSGLREHYRLFTIQGRNGNDNITQEEIIRLNARQKALNFKPGEEFMYCNANYVYMTEIVHRVSGISFAEFSKRYIFEPLGMTSSFFREDADMIIPGRVTSYRDDGYTYKKGIFNISVHGDSGLNTNCRDLTTFIKQYQNPTLISRMTMEELMFHVPEIKKGTTVYGGGLRFNDLLGHRFIHHGGVNAGFRTVGALYPDDDLIITVFANTHTLPIEVAARDVARVVLGLPPRVLNYVKEHRRDEVCWEDIPGVYFCDGNNEVFHISLRDGTVYNGGTPLIHQGGNLFAQGRLDTLFAFGPETHLRRDCGVMKLRKLDTTVDPEEAKALEGVYYNDECQAIYTASYHDGKLGWENLRHGQVRLYPLGNSTYAYGSQTLRFVRNEAGAVTGCLYNCTQVRDLVFEKVK